MHSRAKKMVDMALPDPKYAVKTVLATIVS